MSLPSLCVGPRKPPQTEQERKWPPLVMEKQRAHKGKERLAGGPCAHWVGNASTHSKRSSLSEAF